jgi:hypothetical protein
MPRPTPTGRDERPVVLSYGLGLESTAILARWLLNPDSRPFDLDQLTVVLAQVGSEFPDSIRLVEDFVLPLLAKNRVRLIEVARAGHHEADGITILSDTRTPTCLHPDGDYRLIDELTRVGTVPTCKVPRKCSMKHKGFPLDRAIAQIVGDRPYRHVIGFNCDEEVRVLRDQSFGGSDRTAWYPLLDWRWGRDECTAYLQRVFGVDWPKSCCSFCPFTQGRPDVLKRFHRFPDAAAEALYLEFTSVCLNENVPLYGPNKSLYALLEQAGQTAAFDAFRERLEETDWAIHHVRRLFHRPRPGKEKGTAQRSVRTLWSGGDFGAGVAEITRLAAKHDRELIPAGFDHSWKVSLRERGDDYSEGNAEEFYVLAPASVEEKEPSTFDANWHRLHTEIDLFATA